MEWRRVDLPIVKLSERRQAIATAGPGRKNGRNPVIRALINYQVSYPLSMMNLLLRKALAEGE
jgi:hypothetical protein